jgi:hypothetical protein
MSENSLLKALHGLCVDVAGLLLAELSLPAHKRDRTRQGRLVRILDAAALRYQRRLVILAVFRVGYRPITREAGQCGGK